jgi:hypothetical protein
MTLKEKRCGNCGTAKPKADILRSAGGWLYKKCRVVLKGAKP